jgi:hypothetical protein
MTGVRPLDEYEPEEGPGSPYGSYYVVLPEGPWETDPSTKDPTEPAPKPSGLVGVVTALVAGVIPAMLLDLPAALVAGVAAGVFGGLMGTALRAGFHDRGHGRGRGVGADGDQEGVAAPTGRRHAQHTPPRGVADHG